MPELPEVENLVLELKRVLTGLEIDRAQVRNDSILDSPCQELQAGISGKEIIQVRRIGKYIRIQLSDCFLWFHLGMTGQLLFEDLPAQLDPHVHFILSFAGSRKRLFYRDVRRFGRIALSPSAESEWPAGVRRLGREPKECSQEAFASLFKLSRARIKNLLLNQKVVSGLGNIYADESLHRAGIHPLRRAHELPRRRLFRLHEAICEVLEEATRYGGSSVDDYLHLDRTRGRFQELHRVYGRGGKNCQTCTTPIRKIKLSGRSSSFCPRCQQYRERSQQPARNL